MAMPASGCIALKYCLSSCNCSSIGYAVDGNATGDKSLCTLSETAGCSLPHGMREFLGYPDAPSTNLSVGWISDIPIEELSTNTKKFSYMELTCANLQTGDSFAPTYCYCANLSADACFCFLGRRTGDGFWVIDESGTTSGSGTFTSYNVLTDTGLCIGLYLCDNVDPPTSCVWICLPDPPATYIIGSGVIELETNYCWDACIGNTVTWCQPGEGTDSVVYSTQYCTASVGWTPYSGVLVKNNIGPTEMTGFKVQVSTNSLGTAGVICAVDCNVVTFCSCVCNLADQVFDVVLTGVTRSIPYCYCGYFS